MYDLKKPGYGVYHGPIFDLAKRYLGGRAVDLTGKGFAAVEHRLKKANRCG
ncbi:hypothetical protein [Caenibacillus caldisaponilyticus]|uniref:hypothetical protein n=1 Tax=Caenibacillus caldisaponilyticus TaxID=1674942 RepID=UPI00350E47AD